MDGGHKTLLLHPNSLISVSVSLINQVAMSSTSNPSCKALSKIACNRLQKELVEWQVNAPLGFKHTVTDNLQRWVIEVNGAPETLYANETYQLQVDFPEHYPMEAPQMCWTLIRKPIRGARASLIVLGVAFLWRLLGFRYTLPLIEKKRV